LGGSGKVNGVRKAQNGEDDKVTVIYEMGQDSQGNTTCESMTWTCSELFSRTLPSIDGECPLLLFREDDGGLEGVDSGSSDEGEGGEDGEE